MSRREYDRTPAWRQAEKTGAEYPAWDVMVGWDPPLRSYYVNVIDQTGHQARRSGNDFIFSAGMAGELPGTGDLVETLGALGALGYVDLPLDRVILDVLRADRERNLLNSQQNDEEIQLRRLVQGKEPWPCRLWRQEAARAREACKARRMRRPKGR